MSLFGSDPGNFVVIAPQTNIATRATGSGVTLPVFSVDMRNATPRAYDPMLYGSGISNAFDTFGGLPGNTEGTISIVASIDMVTAKRWLDWAMGAPTTTGSADPWTHVYNANAASRPFYTIAARRAGASAGQQAWDVAIGAQVSRMSFELTGEAGRFARMNMECVARQVLTAQEFSGASSDIAAGGMPTTREGVSAAAGAFAVGGATLARMNAGSISIDFGLQAQRDVGNGGLITDMLRGTNTITASATVRVHDRAQWSVLTARDTRVATRAVWTNSFSAPERDLALDMPHCFVTDSSNPVQAGEFVIGEVAWRAEQWTQPPETGSAPAQTNALRMTLRNGQAS